MHDQVFHSGSLEVLDRVEQSITMRETVHWACRKPAMAFKQGFRVPQKLQQPVWSRHVGGGPAGGSGTELLCPLSTFCHNPPEEASVLRGWSAEELRQGCRPQRGSCIGVRGRPLSFPPTFSGQLGESCGGPMGFINSSSLVPAAVSVAATRTRIGGGSAGSTAKRCRFKAEQTGFYSTYFIVPKKDGGQWPVLDLRRLNRYLKVLPFKMNHTKIVMQSISAGEWFTSLNLKDAYFPVLICSEHQPFLCFAFQGHVFQFLVLPFSLSLARGP